MFITDNKLHKKKTQKAETDVSALTPFYTVLYLWSDINEIFFVDRSYEGDIKKKVAGVLGC